MKGPYALALALGDRLNPVAVKEFRQAGAKPLGDEHSDAVPGDRPVHRGRLPDDVAACRRQRYGRLRGVRGTARRTADHVHRVRSALFGRPHVAGTERCKRRPALHHHHHARRDRARKVYRGHGPDAVDLQRVHAVPDRDLSLAGIDLPTIFMVLGWGFLACAAANAMGIFAGCVPGTWFIRGIIDIGMLIGLFCLLAGTINLAGEFSRFGVGRMVGWEYWIGMATFLVVELLAIGLFYVLAEAMLRPKPSNRMLRPRLYITACWLLTGGIALVGATHTSRRGHVRVDDGCLHWNCDLDGGSARRT